MSRLFTLAILATIGLCAYGVSDPDRANELVAAVATFGGHMLRALMIG